MRKVEVCPYTDEWVVMFMEESKNLKQIFGNEIVAVHHIGSTSVHGIKAKPIIDIMLVVKDINAVVTFDHEMRNLGYEPKGENGIPGRRYFQKGGDNRTHHLHIFNDGSDQIERHLAFRDYLRVFPDVSKRYGDLKQELACEFPYDIESYINGKEELVREIERKALQWYKKNQ